MYICKNRVRYSEVDHTECLRLVNLIDYFQDCSTFQSEDLGYGIDILKEKHRAWILCAWQIEVFRYPRIGEYIEVSTWANGFNVFYGTRNFQMKDISGTVIARADSTWVYMDTDRKCPVRPGEDELDAYRIEAPLNMEKVSRKIRQPEILTTGNKFKVQSHQIDTNEHVNNSQYIQMAVEVLPECAHADKIRVEYKRSALPGEWIVPKVAVEQERKVAELCTEDGNIYAIVEFKEK